MANNSNKPEPTLKELAAGVIPAVDSLLSQIELLNLQIEDLTAQGIARGSISYKAERYAYLIHPTQDGARQRQYIGSDPAAIADAKARLDRGAQVDKIRGKLVRLTFTCSRAKEALWQFYSVTGTKSRGAEYITGDRHRTL